jgi:hypothetical protein
MGTITQLYRPVIDDLGQVTFLADTSKLRGVPDSKRGPLLVRADAAGVKPVSSRHPALGADVTTTGDVAFRTSKNTLSRLLMFSGRRRKTVFRTRDGALADDVAVNDAHEIAFTTARAGVYPHIDFTVTFRAADGTLTNVATVTDLAPGPDLNNAGDVLYADQTGLFRWRQSAAQAVALEGDPTSAGTLDPLSAPSSWAINDAGEVALLGTAEDGAGERPGLFSTGP